MLPETQKFTYGDQFAYGDKPGQVQLDPLLEMVFEHLGSGNPDLFDDETEPTGDRHALQQAIADRYFSHTANPPNVAKNTIYSMEKYGLISLSDDRDAYRVTELGHVLHDEADSNERLRMFARHILVEREGLLLLKIIEDLKSRGEPATLESISEEFDAISIYLPPNSTYASTMKSWLGAVRIFESGYDISWKAVDDVTGLNKDLIDDLYDLEAELKYYLRALVNLDARDFMPSNKVADYVRSVYKIKLTTKGLVKDILQPLEALGLVETGKTTAGRGAKPHDVRLTEKSFNDLLVPFLGQISEITGFTSKALDRSFESVVDDLDSKDTHVKGVALELFAIWLLRLLGIKFAEWRKRSKQTGGGEVDVLAASDKFVYSRWQIQCKNTKKTVDHETIAREVGLTVMTNADVIMIVTTSSFSDSARQYVDLVMNQTRYYVILLDGSDVQKVRKEKTKIVEILDDKARQAFFRKEILPRQT